MSCLATLNSMVVSDLVPQISFGNLAILQLKKTCYNLPLAALMADVAVPKEMHDKSSSTETQ